MKQITICEDCQYRSFNEGLKNCSKCGGKLGLICPRCNGAGLIFERERKGNDDFPMRIRCPKCKGEGKI